MKKIIRKDGQIVPLEFWQTEKKLEPHKLGKFFSVSEFPNQEFILHEGLLDILDAFRAKIGKPVILNSTYRSADYQKKLAKTNSNAVSYSPHTVGLAVDIDTVSESQCVEYAKVLREIANGMGYKCRTIWRNYAKKGQTFVHFDICPTMYGAGGVWEKLECANSWRIELSS